LFPNILGFSVFLNLFLLLVSKTIVLCSENMVFMTYILFNLFRVGSRRDGAMCGGARYSGTLL
jgi:hypothetical protein